MATVHDLLHRIELLQSCSTVSSFSDLTSLDSHHNQNPWALGVASSPPSSPAAAAPLHSMHSGRHGATDHLSMHSTASGELCALTAAAAAAAATAAQLVQIADPKHSASGAVKPTAPASYQPLMRTPALQSRRALWGFDYPHTTATGTSSYEERSLFSARRVPSSTNLMMKSHEDSIFLQHYTTGSCSTGGMSGARCDQAGALSEVPFEDDMYEFISEMMDMQLG